MPKARLTLDSILGVKTFDIEDLCDDQWFNYSEHTDINLFIHPEDEDMDYKDARWKVYLYRVGLDGQTKTDEPLAIFDSHEIFVDIF